MGRNIDAALALAMLSNLGANGRVIAVGVSAQWPTPIVAVGTEVGSAEPYPARSIESDFS
ncbi:MAG TPA: hypothetical protein VMQ86_14230 [Bryobacteraceae bacterium]|jgi:hypothetical protein|nr:hypothetical protein [Bryobacteraceae bacterium]